MTKQRQQVATLLALEGQSTDEAEVNKVLSCYRLVKSKQGRGCLIGYCVSIRKILLKTRGASNEHDE